MRFTVDQPVPAALDAVEAALLDPAFLARMVELPRLGTAEVLDRQRDGEVVRQRVRYHFEAELSAAVRRVVDPAKLTWVEASTHDLSTHTAHYAIEPDNYANLLEGSYDATLEATADGTLRRVTGEVKVHVPLVGGKVEHAIVTGLEENATAQTGLLSEFLSGTRGTA